MELGNVFMPAEMIHEILFQIKKKHQHCAIQRVCRLFAYFLKYSQFSFPKNLTISKNEHLREICSSRTLTEKLEDVKIVNIEVSLFINKMLCRAPEIFLFYFIPSHVQSKYKKYTIFKIYNLFKENNITINFTKSSIKSEIRNHQRNFRKNDIEYGGVTTIEQDFSSFDYLKKFDYFEKITFRYNFIDDKGEHYFHIHLLFVN